MKRPIYLSVAGLLLLVIAATAYFILSTPHIENMALNDLTTARKALATQDYSTAIFLSNDGLKNADTPELKAWFTLILAESFWGRNTGSDRTEAIPYYKQIVNDPGATPVQKAFALNDLSIIINNSTLAFYLANFSDEPFAGFLPASGNDTARLSEAYLQVLKLSDSISPNSFAEYSIAGGYYAPLIARTTDSTSIENLVNAAKGYVAIGDAKSDQSIYSNYPLIKELYYRALALSTIGRISGMPSLAERVAAYQKVLDMAPSAGGGDSAATIFNARFFYAVLLLNSNGNPSEISDLLKPFGAIPADETHIGLFANYATAPSFIRENAVKLAAVSPEFKNFLTGVTNQ